MSLNLMDAFDFAWRYSVSPNVRIASLEIAGQRLGINPAEMTPVASDGESRSWQLDAPEGVRVRVLGRYFAQYQAAEWTMELENTGEQDSPMLERICSADLTLPMPEERAVVHSGLNGDSNSGASFLPFRRPLVRGEDVRVHPEGGRSSCREFPFFDLEWEDGGAIVAIGWSGQWLYSIQRDAEAVRLTAGMEYAAFRLRPGERVRLPRILVKTYADFTEGHNSFRRLMKECYSPQAMRSGGMLPSALQCFDRYAFTTPYWCSEDGQREYASSAARIGHIDTVWLDAAWFEGAFPHGVGNYRFAKGFPNGLCPVSDHVHQLGMRFMLWFEPERVAYGTDMDREHPDWIIRDPDAKPWDWTPQGQSDDARRASGLLNLARPEVVDHLIDRLSGIIEEKGIDIFRQDFNIAPLKFWHLQDAPDRLGLTEIHYIEGLYRLWDSLQARFPQLLIDNCASGGRRIDLETCMRAVPLWRSDTGCSPLSDARPSDMWNQNQSLSLSKYLVYHSVAAWNWNAYEFRSAATNGMAANFDVFGTDFDYAHASECMAEFERLRKYWLGDFYPLAEATLDDSVWAAFQFHRPEADDGLVMVFRRAGSEDSVMRLCLRGLKPEVEYAVTFSDEQRRLSEKRITGRALMDGFAFEIDERRGSLAVEYHG